MNTQTLLIELGTEELPPKSLKKLGEAFKSSIEDSLVATELVILETAGEYYLDTSSQNLLAAPRRLAFLAKDVLPTQPDQKVERKGPAVKSAFKDDGTPTPAVLGFAKSCGVEIDALERRETDKGEWLFFSQTVAGRSITDIAQEALDKAIKSLPIAKRMRWGDKQVEFVRPVHWLVALHGETILPVQTLGLAASNQTQGHRFHSEGTLTIDSADSYINTLQDQGKVVVDYEERKKLVSKQIDGLAKSVDGSTEFDPDLLDEVCSLVEFPKAILGSIDERFMNVPQESLVSSMRDHQKYFHIVDANGKLMPYFITVSNIDSKDEDRVRNGNERVLRARLSDAEFFWETDKKFTLESRLPALDNVLYHKKLGSMANKVARLELITKDVAKLIGADVAISTRGAKLAKADLTSQMVGEFSDLQGIMGRYYAQNDGEEPLVAQCAEQHYWPKSATGALPESKEITAVSLADKLDSLVGIFSTGETPTGDKDPYALRRAALGVLRMCTYSTIASDELKLSELISIAAKAYSTQNIDISANTQKDIIDFIQSRYKAFYQEGFSTSLINAVSASDMNCPTHFDSRIKGLNVFATLPEAKTLAAANKRIGNILKKVDDLNRLNGDIDTTLIESGSEQALFDKLSELESKVNSLFNDHQYEQGLTKLAALKEPVDAFFDDVMVMAEDEAVKTNRLKLLQKLQNLFLRVADISVL